MSTRRVYVFVIQSVLSQLDQAKKQHVKTTTPYLARYFSKINVLMASDLFQ